MSTLISNRFLFPEFTGRNVVFRSSMTVSLTGNLNARATVDFGKHGSVDVSMNLDCSSFDAFRTSCALNKHTEEVLSIIDGLECFLDWTKKPVTDTFSHFCENEDPIYVYGSKKKMANGRHQVFVMELFGRKLNGLDVRGADGITPQVTAIIRAFQDHLKSLESITMQELIDVVVHKSHAFKKAKERSV